MKNLFCTIRGKSVKENARSERLLLGNTLLGNSQTDQQTGSSTSHNEN